MSTFHLVQTSLAWEDPAANQAMLENKLLGVMGGVIVLPEMFSTGFSMASKALAEPMDGKTVSWLKSIAATHQAAVCGSVIIRADDQYYNRFIWHPAQLSRENKLTYYDKRHLFRMAQEHQYYSSGSRHIVIQHDAARIMPQICYDLRFPAWSRNTSHPVTLDAFKPAPLYDVLLYVANWPAARQQQWLALLRARAIENLCYVVAVNRIGLDGNGVEYEGGSCAITPTGEYLVTPSDKEGITTIDLDLQALHEYRERFPAYLDADSLHIDH
jgi:omega-amidase